MSGSETNEGVAIDNVFLNWTSNQIGLQGPIHYLLGYHFYSQYTDEIASLSAMALRQ